MARIGTTPFAFPDFRGATRRLVLLNLACYLILLLAGFAMPFATNQLVRHLVFISPDFLHGQIWQPITYSLVHYQLFGTLMELLSLWFLVGFLEPFHGDSWVMGLYIASVVGTAVGAIAVYFAALALDRPLDLIPLYGCFGAIFGLLVAIGVLYGDVQFMMFFVIGIKARYLAIIYGLICFVMLFGQQRMYAFAQFGGALFGWLYLRFMPRRGFGFAFSEQWYGMRNRYYRWKRRRAARKFEVYMRSQGRTVHFDGQGRQIDDEQNDKSRWN